MSYDNTLKCDKEIFEKVRFVPVGDEIILKPIFAEMLDAEAAMYLENSKTNAIKKYLPSVYVESVEQAKELLLDFIQKTIFCASILYCIRLKNQQFPFGYINISSPLVKSGLETWTIDFWIAEKYEGNGIMTACLGQMLHYLQQNQVPEMMAIVHQDNLKTQKVLEKLGFQIIDKEADGEERYLYKILLN